jgi:hypothetical protein
MLFELKIPILNTIYGTPSVVPGIFLYLGKKWHKRIKALLEE